ncbi:ead/Ea22-like family protein [Klebsiella pneumoniae]|uniref:ead/Ea22-like family protein n=1 Tax=Klebsiella pneumoniae TaxID=573 RepID=UPI0023B0CEDA|nr:ead/Ea22-like family protein [Klebsiella pneumoniae]MDE9299379.1 ead/Ea22-like family protein [Klebsiella pneumoniae]MDH2441319.1 ead/Ea22-like family protein [Klebsiella pneumoniae]
MTDITELAQSLKAAAEKATQGNWRAFKYHDGRCGIGGGHHDEIMVCEHISKRRPHDAEFIAMANPADILALVEALEKAQAKNALVAGGIEAVAKLHERIAELEDAEQKLCAANVTLDARAELAERQLAELESRTVKLPPTFWYEHDDLSRDVPVLDKRLVKKMLREAGIKVEAE